MAARPSALPALVPQSPERIQWEEAVALAIEGKEEMSRSDAQGVMEAQHRALDRAWSQGLSPERSARRVIDAATPRQGASM